MADQTNRKKHVSYAKQREVCRLAKFTYEEKCSTCSQNFLMCNFPFPEPDHKKGFCRASTCTDMREIPDMVVEADKQEGQSPVSTGPGGEQTEALEETKLADSGACEQVKPEDMTPNTE
jgi:hypothetical protein